MLEALGSSSTQNITITKTVIESNIADENTMQFMYSSVMIDQVQFTTNVATQHSKNIFIGFSQIYISNCQFTGKSSKTLNTNALQAD